MKTINVVFLLDRSGSMYTSQSDTIGGFNRFIADQKKSKFNIKFSLTLFNSNNVEKRYVDEDISNVKDLDDNNYQPNHGTPLWDAVGTTMRELGNKKDVLFVIMTDGQENDSTEFTANQVREMIKEKEKIAWKFLYLGIDVANFDDAMSLGIQANFNMARGAVGASYDKLSQTVGVYANTGEVKYDSDDEK